MAIPVIDLFAGPGGLGEGFSSLRDSNDDAVFKIHLSVEKDPSAHKTLELRSFFRQFPDREAPDGYYRYIRKEGISREELFEHYPSEAGAAQKEAWWFELTEEHAKEIDRRITVALNGEKMWVLIGGPPCQAYSIVGRSRMRGADPSKYENDPRHHLYQEYLRILETHRPPVFVMENVKGLLSSRVNGEGIFQRIINDISLLRHNGKESGYRLFSLNRHAGDAKPGDFVIHAEKHGIPQKRHRVIIIGVRNDFDAVPERLYDGNAAITVRDTIGDLPKIRSGLSKEHDSYVAWSGVLEEFVKDIGGIESVPEDVRREIEVSCTGRDSLNLGGEFISSDQVRETSEWLREQALWFYDETLGTMFGIDS